MKKILVFGLGKVGSLVGTLLHHRFEVTGFDKAAPAEEVPFEIVQGDVTDATLLAATMEG